MFALILTPLFIFPVYAQDSVPTHGGNISALTLYVDFITQNWYGLAGQVNFTTGSTNPSNVTEDPGNITDPRFSLQAGCEAATAVSGYMIFTNKSSLPGNLTPGNLTLLDSLMSGTDDLASQTFTTTENYTILGSTVNNVPTVYTYVNNSPQSSTFREGYFQDNVTGDLVFATNITADNPGYNLSAFDYQALIPAINQTTTAYNVFVSINYSCAGGWSNISAPEGIFEPVNASLSGTHVNFFSIFFTNLTIRSAQTLSCNVKTANGSNLEINATGVDLTETNYTLNYTVLSTDSIINDGTYGYLPWIIKNCSLVDGATTLYNESTILRIYTHNPVYWEDDEVTRAVACQNAPARYFNNTAKCEFSEDAVFALQMRNGNPVNETCFNDPGTSCADPYCNGLYFPTCDPLDYFGGYSALTDDPNNVGSFTSAAPTATEVWYSVYTNTSNGTLKIRVRKTLSGKTFTITIDNLTQADNSSKTNIYGNETGSAGLDVVDQGDGTWAVQAYRLGTGNEFTGTLDFVFNISFTNASMNEHRNVGIIIAYGTDTNAGNPDRWPIYLNTTAGLRNNNESQNSSITTDYGGNTCGDDTNNDFDYLGSGGTIWSYSYDCFDVDCNGSLGGNKTNEIAPNVVANCSFSTEAGYCNDTYDNDYDYILGTDYTDCHDADCFHLDPACPTAETVCNDSINNDWDYTLGETDYSASQKIENNGTKYDGTYIYNLTDCEDIDCNASQGGTSTQLCNWGFETNCSDGFDNDVLQLYDCNLATLSGSTDMPFPGDAEYDCTDYCRATNFSTETGSYCNDSLDNDWDAIYITGYYNNANQYSSNTSSGAGTDCRWGGYGSIGTNYNPDEDCNQTNLGSNITCELQFELTCNDTFDNDFDTDASGMPSAGWSNNQAGYLAYFNFSYLNDADYDDYDCKSGPLAPSSEAANSSWCFDSVDNDLNYYYWSGTTYVQNSSDGIDCGDPDCLGVSNPANSSQTCLNEEYNESDSFFQNLANPGQYCDNTFDDDDDDGLGWPNGGTDCDDPDCNKKFDLCDGPCYDTENVTWDACTDSTDNDDDMPSAITDCSDSDCYSTSMIGNLEGAICQASETRCYDGFNNDAQGGTDCSDHTDCDNRIGDRINDTEVYCNATEVGSACFDGFNNDADSNTDCMDSNCNDECNLPSISGTSPITLPDQAGQTSINSVTDAYIGDYTEKIRNNEWYNISMKMTGASTDAQWTLGTASGATFNKSAFNTSSAYLAGPNADNFTLTETVNGFILDSQNANLPSGYTVYFLIKANITLASSTYELTYAETTGSKTSLNNYIYHEVVENITPEAHAIHVVPNSTGMDYGGSVYIRANISDNNQLGLCDWYVYGAASFNPGDSVTCVGSFTPTFEGTYFINVTPVDYYNNRGTPITKSYSLNILPTPALVTINKSTPFYNSSKAADTLEFNATFNLVTTNDTLGTCQILVENSTGNRTVIESGFAATGNSCYKQEVNISSLADGGYRIFAKVTETTEGDIIESNATALFICSQLDSGLCKLADYSGNGKPDICDVESNITITITDTPDPVFNGSTLNYTITYNNYGANDARNVNITVTYPNNTTYVSATPSPNVSNNLWQLGTLGIGDSGQINITITVDADVPNGTVLNFTVNVSYINSTFDLVRFNQTVNTTVTTGDFVAPTISIISCSPDPVNVSDNVTCIANVSDETAIGSVWANVTLPGGIVQNQTVSCSGSSTSQQCNFTFTNTTTIGLHNATWYANDTSNNLATEQRNFTVQDPTIPTITTIDCLPDPINQSENVTCTANITDNLEVDSVWANITLPNGTDLNQTVLCSGTATLQQCNFTFTNATLAGLHNATWYANDTSNNQQSAVDNFTVEGVAVLEELRGEGGSPREETKFIFAVAPSPAPTEPAAPPEIERIEAVKTTVSDVRVPVMKVPTDLAVSLENTGNTPLDNLRIEIEQIGEIATESLHQNTLFGWNNEEAAGWSLHTEDTTAIKWDVPEPTYIDKLDPMEKVDEMIQFVPGVTNKEVNPMRLLVYSADTLIQTQDFTVYVDIPDFELFPEFNQDDQTFDIHFVVKNGWAAEDSYNMEFTLDTDHSTVIAEYYGPYQMDTTQDAEVLSDKYTLSDKLTLEQLEQLDTKAKLYQDGVLIQETESAIDVK